MLKTLDGGESLIASGQVLPMFTAVVDPIDPAAVVALLALLPNENASGLRAFERSGGKWVESKEYQRKLMGITPPPLVELDRETLMNVVEQIDDYDRKKGKE